MNERLEKAGHASDDHVRRIATDSEFMNWARVLWEIDFPDEEADDLYDRMWDMVVRHGASPELKEPVFEEAYHIIEDQERERRAH